MSSGKKAKKIGNVEEHLRPPFSHMSATPIEDQLKNGEKLIWSGKPNPEELAGAHAGAVLMGIACISFAIIWHQVVFQNVTIGATGIVMDSVQVVTWLFAGLGSIFLSIPLFVYLIGAHYMLYAVTNKRLMIIRLFPTASVQSFPINDVFQVNSTVLYGMGNLLFDLPGVKQNHLQAYPGFYGIPSPLRIAEVFNTLKHPEHAKRSAEEKNKLKDYMERKKQDPQWNKKPSINKVPVPSSHLHLMMEKKTGEIVIRD
ncbi:hypothetical protein [Magnetovibrio blakemorei]|nr:hypothetical protein [Magnetovibrio blakemorei]